MSACGQTWEDERKCWNAQNFWASHKCFWKWHIVPRIAWFLDLAIILYKNKTPWKLNLIPSSSEKSVEALVSQLLE